MNSFILGFWSRVFGFLGRVSVFRLFWSVLPASLRTYGTVDAWVLANLVLSIVGLVAVTATHYSAICVVAAVYASVRVFEIAVYQINVVLFDAYRHAKAGGIASPVKGYRRLVVLILQNYAEIVFWFAILYSVNASHFPVDGNAVPQGHTLNSCVGRNVSVNRNDGNALPNDCTR